jgi:all-trans-retinol 13,14-reductase
MPEGALYCFEQSSEVKRPGFKTPSKGLYLASASSGHGGGIESVAMTGIICSHDINGWKKE